MRQLIALLALAFLPGCALLCQLCGFTPTPPDPPNPPSSSAIYLSPSGRDADACTEAAPCRTFAKAFGTVKAGGEVVLLDGSYSVASGTGSIHYEGQGSAQPPSGTATAPTRVRSKNAGAVHVNSLFIGRSTRKDRYITVDGITFGRGDIYNGDNITIRNSGFGAGFGIGTNDHEQGNENNLVEDVWIWAKAQRVIAINYRAHKNVWRRVIVRGDGCGTAACRGSGNPNVGITVYDSQDVSLQNVMVLDRVLAAGDSHYADFACAAHTPREWPFGRNEWLGIVSRNAPDSGFYCEPDEGATVGDVFRLSHASIWSTATGGINMQRELNGVALEFLTVNTRAGSGLRVRPSKGKPTVAGVIVTGRGQYGINSEPVTKGAIVSGAWTGGAYYDGSTCSGGCSTSDPGITDPTQSGDAARGATISYRYGVNGSRFGEPSYNALSTVPLWPWPNEARIKADMCKDTTRGFCSASSITAYVRSVTAP